MLPTWLHIPGCLALGEWSHHHDYLGSEDLFCTVLLCILPLFLIPSDSVRFITFLSFIVPIFAWNVPLIPLIFLKGYPVFPILLFSSISLHWLLRKPFLSLLLFFRTLHSNGYIFPFLLCFLLLFYSQLLVCPPQAAILCFCISFSWGWSWSLSLVQCREPPSIVHQALTLSDLVP